MTGTILTYLKEQGEIPFSEKPLNEVDSLILCQFAYLKFDGLVPDVDETAEPVPVKALSTHPDRERLFSDERYEKVNRELFLGMTESRRFGGLRLGYYVNLIEKDWETQFSAVTIFLEDGGTYVAFRGTDESLVGWREDCNMALHGPIPAQQCALKYLKRVAEKVSGSFFLGGHSKGGNLAIYAAMNAAPELQERILTIYNMDGPGFRPEVREKSAYDKVSDRIEKILPRSSFIGMLFEQEPRCRVVESKSLGLFQHNPYSWVVSEDHFIMAPDLYQGRKFMDKAINSWILTLREDQIKTFIDTLFTILEASEAEDLVQLEEDKKKSMLGMVGAMKEIDETTRRAIAEILKSLFEIAGRDALSELDRKLKETGKRLKG
ncbi:MAG: DUF2974 domain-containing protein [Lachnospiraceae bacterium]|nr:DUF2974 domain-containing protein [Lachnospiraceae bacterium]